MFRNREAAVASSSGVGAPTVAVATADVTAGSDPTFADLCSCSVSGTAFRVEAVASGLGNGAGTGRLRVLIDNVEYTGLSGYGTDYVSGSGAQMVVNGVKTGLSSGAHTFKLQMSYGGSSWTVHANTNPTREYATLMVTATA